jgi:hypothetical protein
MTTNAQGRFRPEMGRCGFSEIVCSIDGVDSQTYAPYRVHGNFDLAWRFLNDFNGAGSSSDHRTRVVWKYVLFEHNSSPDNLLKAQQMALDAGVSELVFVLTRNGQAPRDICSPADVPRLQPGPPVSFRFHQPSIEDLEARLAQARSARETPEDAAAMIESVRRNLERFFPSGDTRPERHQRLLEDLQRTGSRLPVLSGEGMRG